MIHPPKKAEQVERPAETAIMPATFEADYIEGVVKPFFLSSKFVGEPPLLPMRIFFVKDAERMQPTLTTYLVQPIRIVFHVIN